MSLRLKKALISLVATGGALLLAEAVFRGYTAYTQRRDLERLIAGANRIEIDTNNLGDLVRLSTHPDIMYELKPNLRGRYWGARLTTNAAGLRGNAPADVANPKRAFRIVGLGDSFMFGHRVANDEVFLEVLRRRIERERKTTVEAFNFALSGYNTAMEAAVFESKAAAYRPNLVIVDIIGNDMELPTFLARLPTVRPLGSALLGALRDLFRRPSGLSIAPGLPPSACTDRARLDFAIATAPPELQHLVGFDAFFDGLDRIVRTARSLGAPVVLSSDCLKRHPGGLGCDFVFTPRQREALWAAFRRWDVTVCRWVVPPEEKIPGDGHWTPRGHARIADALYRCLEERRLLPR